VSSTVTATRYPKTADPHSNTTDGHPETTNLDACAGYSYARAATAIV